jgi:phytoene desaturase
VSAQPHNRVAVIGGGLGGLTAACTLAARGYRVMLLEANAWLGGKAAVWEHAGFRFDMGPTILTVPSVLARIFGEAGENVEDNLELVALDPQWRCFFEDGSVLDLHADTERMRGVLETYAPGSGSAEGYGRFMELSERLHGIAERHFFWRSLGGVRDMLGWGSLLGGSLLKDVLGMRMSKTVGGTVREHIPDSRVAQMVDHYTQYVGSAPDASPAVLCGIAHMQATGGVWYPMGGTRAVPVALAGLAERLGVELRTNAPVRGIRTAGGGVSAIELADGEVIPVDAVVSNMDAVRTHRELLDDERAARRFAKRRPYEPACSGVVLYLGLKERYDHLLHHDFVFSRDPEEEFDAIYRQGIPAPDPTCYLAAPSRTEPGVAPEGGEALYVLVHTPYLRPGHDWSAMLPGYRRTILDKLRRTAGLEDIEDRIVCERTLTPQDIHDRYHVLNGAIYGIASHGRLRGGFKPANRSPDVRGLYLAGGASHPGPGMPMVMMSGWIAADSLDQDGVAPKLGRGAGATAAPALTGG